MKKFTTQEIRDLLNRVMREEISFSEMVEEINQRVSEADKKCVEDIPKRKFKEGDKVQIKEGISSKTHDSDDCPLHLECARWLDRLPMEEYWYSDFDPENCEDYIEKNGIKPKQKKKWNYYKE